MEVPSFSYCKKKMDTLFLEIPVITKQVDTLHFTIKME